MIQTIKNYVYGSGTFPINTIIGGVGATINTKELLASTLGISVNRIRRFEIDGTTLRVNILDNYVIKDYAFQYNTSLTDFLDFDGKCLSVQQGTFQGTTSLINLHIPNAGWSNSALFGARFTNPLFNGEFLTYIAGNSALNALRETAFKKFNAPNLTTLTGISSLQGNTELVDLHTPNLKTIASRVFSGCTKLNCAVYNFQNIEGISAHSFSGCTSQEYFYAPKATYVGIQAFRNMYAVKTIILPEVTICYKDFTFQNAQSVTLISMKKLKDFDGAASIGNVFNGIKTGCVIEVNIHLATWNAGSPDAALVWVKANRAAIVKFYDDDGNYVSTL